MSEGKNAYEVLGLSEDASKDEIEKRYEVLVRKYKNNPELNESGTTIEDITRAYRKLMGLPIEEEIIKDEATLRREKVSNFIYYYKWHFIIGIIVIAMLISLGKAVFGPKPDFNLAIIGAYYYDDQKILEEYLENNIDDINMAAVDGVSFAINDDLTEYESMMKASVLLAAGDIDLFILDNERFEGYAEMGSFERLDDYLDKLGIDAQSEKLYYARAEDDNKEYVYGIDISNSEIFVGFFTTATQEKIACIRYEAKNIDKAIEVIKLLLR